MVEAGELAAERRDELMGRVGAVFTRREPFQQRLLKHASWDHQAAMRVVRDFVVEHLTNPHTGCDPVGAVAVLDETGQEGTGTIAVKRQYVGCAGRVANAVNAVYVVYRTYATARGHAQVGARLYVPRNGPPGSRRQTGRTPPPMKARPADTPPRARAVAQTDSGTTFRTKPRLAVDILTGLRTAGVLPAWVTGDEVYARDPALRAFCQDRGAGFVLGVPCSHRVQLHATLKTRADKALGLVPAKGWTRASCGPGSKGDRLYAWAWIATASARHHLLVRRNLKDPADQAFFYGHVPEPRPQTLRTLVRVAGMRWPVEEDFQVGKDQFGLDHSQVRVQHALASIS
jgi:SRSO17 transposase